MEWNKTRIILSIFMFTGAFLSGAAINMPSPFLPRESELHGVGSTVTGLMLGVLSLAESIFALALVKLTLKIGVGNLFKVGTLLAGLSSIALGTLQFIPHHWSVFFAICGFVVRAVQGVGTTCVMQGCYIRAAEDFAGNKGLMLGSVSASNALGMTLGPAIGSGLFRLGGFWLIFIATGVFTVLVAIPMFFFLPKHAADEIKFNPQSESLPFKAVFTNLRFTTVVVVFGLANFCLVAVDPILEPELRNNYGVEEANSALILLIPSFCYAVGTPLLGKFIGRRYCMDNLLVIVTGLLCGMVGFILAGPFPPFSLTKQLWMIILSLFLMGIGYALLYVASQHVIFDVDSLELSYSGNITAITTLATSTLRFTGNFGTFIGYVVAGGLGEAVGWEWAMSSLAFTCAVLMLPTLFVYCKKKLSLTLGLVKFINEIA